MPLMAEMFGTGLTGTGAHPYCLFIDGLDVIKQPGTAGSIFGTDIDSVTVKEVMGQAPRMEFIIDDPANALSIGRGANVYFCDHQGRAAGTLTDDVFRGVITSRELIPNAVFRQWKVSAVGLQDILNRRVIPSGVILDGMDFPAAVQVVAGNYLDERFSSLQTDANAINSVADLITHGGNGTVVGNISLSGKTVMRALQDIAKAWSRYSTVSSDRFYNDVEIDPQGRLLMAAPDSRQMIGINEGSALGLGKPGPARISVDEDTSNLVNAVYVHGVDTASSGWIVDSDSIATYGRFEKFLEAPSVTSSTIRDAQGAQYLKDHNVHTRLSFQLSGAKTLGVFAGTVPSPATIHQRYFCTLTSGSGFWSTGFYWLGEVSMRWSGGGTFRTVDLVWSAGGKSVGTLLAQQVNDALATSEAGGRLSGTLGEVAVRVKAGTPADTDFDVARDGFLVLDTSSNSLWMRSGTWKRMGSSSPVGCIVTRTTNQSITNATWTPIQFDVADTSDPYGFHDPASNNTRITIPAGYDGTYLAAGYAIFATGTGLSITYGWGLNGANPTTQFQVPGSAAILVSVSPVQEFELVAGDYIELRVFHAGAGAVNVSSAFADLTYVGDIQ